MAAKRTRKKKIDQSPVKEVGVALGQPATPSPRQLAKAKLNNPVPGDGFDGPFFGPHDPIQPVADKTARGRRFNLPVGINLTYGPRQQQGQNAISFELLRRFADPTLGGPDIVRALIERRKSQMKAQTFQITQRDKKGDGGSRARAIEQLLRKPDGKRRYRSWFSSILEDHFVIDAVAIYPVVIGGRPCFRQIDGATIDVLVDYSGDIPLPPLPAYQQNLQSLPAVDYTTDELAYFADNQRVNKLYGMSPVEQMVGIITLIANRQLSLLNYFTSGSVPDMLIGTPEAWNPDQIAQFQEWWDSLLAGNLAERRHARFIPGGNNVHETKSDVLKEPWFDEFMTRLACFVFGISPQSFVKEMNRATSETAKETSLEEGLEPTKLFAKDLFDDLLERGGADDLELVWQDEEIQDPLDKATFVVSLRGGSTGSAKPVITLAEQRKLLDLPEATPDQLDELDPPTPEPPPGLPPGGPVKTVPAPKQLPAKTEDVKKAATSRGGRSLPPVRPNARLRKQIQKGIERVAKGQIERQRKAVIAALHGDTAKLAKADPTPSVEDLQRMIQAIIDGPWDEDAEAKLVELISTLAEERSTAALDHVGDYVAGTDAAYLALLNQANARAVTWAKARVGNLVTEVSNTTRAQINELTSTAIDEGITNAQLAGKLSDSFGFSAERSTMIARTETAFAESQGTLIGFQESGVVSQKEWLPDAEACEICIANAEQGPIPLEDDFESGDDAPPAHPNCECSVVPVVDAEAA